jgi:uncharacterized membrane protein YkvA (DUF1232 family)
LNVKYTMAASEQEQDLLERILGSVFFRKSVNKADRISRNSTGILNLLKNVLNKSKELGVGGVFDLIREKIVTIGSLLKSYASGEYRDVEVKSLVIMIAGLVYFLSPLDFIPDFLPLLGYADDIALLTFILKSVSDEIEKYELWKINKDLN